jgi:hypothetical protein
MPDARGHLHSQVIRPNFARGNTEVMIVDDSVPNSPSGGIDEPITATLEDGITLADIPQVAQAELSGVPHALGRHPSTPYISELSPLALTIVKHAAVAALTRSPLANQFDLDEILELVEAKKAGFWTKLFKQNNDKKMKKKGKTCLLVCLKKLISFIRCIWHSLGGARGARRIRFDAWHFSSNFEGA